MERMNPRNKTRGSGRLQRNASGNRRSAGKHKTKLSRPLAVSKIALLILAAALAVTIVLSIFFNRPSEADMEALKDDGTFFSGITINGVDVSGLTYNQARSAVLPSVEKDLYSASITVTHGTAYWILTAADMKLTSTLDATLTEALSLGRSGTVIENSEAKAELAQNGRAFTVTFVPDETALQERLAAIGAAVDTAPQEPYAEAVSTASEPTFVFHEGQDGFLLNEEELYRGIVEALASGELVVSMEPELEFTAPTLTVEDVKQQTQLLSTFQTSFGGSRAARNEKRVGNIQKACTLLNGLCIDNQTEFNFNGYIGPRTEEGGWPLAPGIVNGNQYEDQAGGGICQVSTTMYNALLCANASMQRGSTLEEILAQDLAGISITERKHHSWPSSYVDTGLDSTVTGTVESGKSLNFANNTGAPLFLFAFCDQEAYTVTIYLYGAPLPDGVTYQVRGVVDETIEPDAEIITYDTTLPADYNQVTITARKGYKATAYRDKYINGVLESTETLYTETYRAVTGERTIGTGGAPAPSATANP